MASDGMVLARRRLASAMAARSLREEPPAVPEISGSPRVTARFGEHTVPLELVHVQRSGSTLFLRRRVPQGGSER